jgi:alditol oxidase
MQTNWAGNLVYGARVTHHPRSMDELCELVRKSPRVRALGTRHCFSTVADTDAELISLDKMPRVMELDARRQRITVDGGVRYGEVGAFLHNSGLALHNLASLPHISVAGGSATATHGAGMNNKCLSAAVCGMEIVGPDGTVRAFSREKDGEAFNGMPVHLGSLGIITKLTLEVQPTFEIRQTVYEMVTADVLEKHFDEVMSAAYSVSLFTPWRGDGKFQLWLKERVDRGSPPPREEIFGAKAAKVDRHPLPGNSAEHCTPQCGIAGPWYERLPHFRMGFTPSDGEELQSEYFVARRHGMAALRALATLHQWISPLLLISEVRTIAADDLWMSPFCGEDSVAFHFTWKRDWAAVREVLPWIETALSSFDARPHWGKLFKMPASRVRELYPRREKFRELVRSLDPEGKFRNDFVDAYVFGP